MPETKTPSIRTTVGLDYLTVLLTDTEELQGWLDTCEPEIRQPFVKAVLIVSGLCEITGQATSVLLDELHCRHRDAANVRRLTADQIRHCSDFLSWVLDLASSASDDRALARSIARAAAAVYFDAGCELDVCRTVMSTPMAVDDSTTAVELLEVGETKLAFSVARSFLPGVAGERAARLRRRQGPTARHLRIESLDALLRYSNGLGDRRDLPPRRATALLGHIGRCRDCTVSYWARARALDLEPADLLAVRRCHSP